MGFGAASGSRADVLFKKYITSSLYTSEPDGGMAKKLEPDNTGFYRGNSGRAGSPKALREWGLLETIFNPGNLDSETLVSLQTKHF